VEDSSARESGGEMGTVAGLKRSGGFGHVVLSRTRKASERLCGREDDGIGSIEEDHNRGCLHTGWL
jgi:hypothetical protein